MKLNIDFVYKKAPKMHYYTCLQVSGVDGIYVINFTVTAMVLILDGSLEHGAHIWSNLLKT